MKPRQRYFYLDNTCDFLLLETIKKIPGHGNRWEVNIISSDPIYAVGFDQFYPHIGTWKLLPNQDKPYENR